MRNVGSIEDPSKLRRILDTTRLIEGHFALGDLLRHARVGDAAGQARSHAEPLLDLTQHQQAAIGRQPPAVKAGNNRLAGDR